ncbi:MAG: flagellar basal body protein [Pseudomonadota bacterium]
MSTQLNILDMALSLTRHSATRQALVTENIANADTPGFKAKDVHSFADVYRAPGEMMRDAPFRPTAVRPGHTGAEAAMSGTDGLRHMEVIAVSGLGAEEPNGNTVALEDQMARGAELRATHDLALGIMRKSMAMLRMTLGRSG